MQTNRVININAHVNNIQNWIQKKVLGLMCWKSLSELLALVYKISTQRRAAYLDQLANLHFHFTSVPRCTPMTD